MAAVVSCYRELAPGSAVHAAVWASFTEAGASNLVLARGRVLEIYAVAGAGAATTLALEDRFALFGNVASLAAVRCRPPGCGGARDALLATFHSAKAVLLGYDGARRRLRSLALLNFEPGSVGPGSAVSAGIDATPELRSGAFDPPRVAVDPSGRCAVMLVHGTHLAVIPFRSSARGRQQQQQQQQPQQGDAKRARTMAEMAAEQAARARPAGEAVGLLGAPYVVNLAEAGFAGFVVDFCFLRGYAQPTLALLQEEPQRTWAGNVYSRRHTCKLSAVSFNVAQRLQTSVWPAATGASLPHDSRGLIPVAPEVGGGVVVLAANAAIYLSQTRSTATATNGFARTTVDRRYAAQPNDPPLALTLDLARFAQLENSQFLLSLKSGDLLLLSLQLSGAAGGSREVVGLRFAKAPSSGLPAEVMCDVPGGRFFMGSTIGNSHLIAFSRTVAGGGGAAEAAAKALPTLDMPDAEDDDEEEDDEEDAAMYGGGAEGEGVEESKDLPLAAGMTRDIQEDEDEDDAEFAADADKDQAFPFKLEVTDTLFGTGPISGGVLGRVSVNEDDVLGPKAPDPMEEHEQVFCAGSNASGALVRMQHGARHEVQAVIPVEDVVHAVWSLRAPGPAAEDDSVVLISARQSCKAVLRDEEGVSVINDAAELGFATADGTTTLAAANVGADGAIAQVHQGGVRLLGAAPAGQRAMPALAEWALPGDDAHIHAAAVHASGFVALHMAAGTVVVVRASAAGGLEPVELPDAPADVTAVALARLPVSVFGSEAALAQARQPKSAAEAEAEFEEEAKQASKQDEGEDEEDEEDEDDEEDDEEDMAMYGGAPAAPAPAPAAAAPAPAAAAAPTEQEQDQAEAFLITAHADGRLEARQLPGGRLAFRCPGFDLGPREALNALAAAQPADAPEQPNRPQLTDVALARVGAGEHHALCLVGMLDSGDVLVYRHAPRGAPGSWVRWDHETPTRPWADLRAGAAPAAPRRARIEPGRLHFAQLHPFDNVAGARGLFVCGQRPGWLLGERGGVKLMPVRLVASDRRSSEDGRLVVDGVRALQPLSGLAPLHMADVCERGFVDCSGGRVRICQLPAHCVTGLHAGPLALQRVKLHATPHAVAYVSPGGAQGAVADALEVPTYCVAVSKPVPFAAGDIGDAMDTISGKVDGAEVAREDPTPKDFVDVAAPDFEALGGAPRLALQQHSLRLVQSGRWNVVDKHDLQPGERVLALKALNLHKGQRQSLRQMRPKDQGRPFVAVGTGFVSRDGEDAPGKGRLVIYEVAYAQYMAASGEAGAKQAKLRQLADKTEKGPVSAVDQVHNLIIYATGPKVLICTLMDDDLMTCSFFDAHMHITSMSVVKDYILFTDVHAGLHFLRWKERDKSLTLLSKDHEPVHTMSGQWLLDPPAMGLLACDARHNLQLMRFAPQRVDSKGGTRLLRGADFHLGAGVERFLSCPRLALDRQGSHARRHVVTFGTTDGGFGALTPVDETVFHRLKTLASVMVYALEHPAGLNPREFRAMRQPFGRTPVREQSITDGALLWRFLSLREDMQRELANSIGTRRDTILQSLLEVDIGLLAL